MWIALCHQEGFSCQHNYHLLRRWSTYSNGRSISMYVASSLSTTAAEWYHCCTVNVDSLSGKVRQSNLESLLFLLLMCNGIKLQQNTEGTWFPWVGFSYVRKLSVLISCNMLQCEHLPVPWQLVIAYTIWKRAVWMQSAGCSVYGNAYLIFISFQSWEMHRAVDHINHYLIVEDGISFLSQYEKQYRNDVLWPMVKLSKIHCGWCFSLIHYAVLENQRIRFLKFSRFLDSRRRMKLWYCNWKSLCGLGSEFSNSDFLIECELNYHFLIFVFCSVHFQVVTGFTFAVRSGPHPAVSLP